MAHRPACHQRSSTRRILLADDELRLRSALRLLLEYEGHHIVGEAADGRSLLLLAIQICPDILLVDWELPGLPPSKKMSLARPLTEVLTLIRSLCPQTRIIALSVHPEARQPALASGVNGFVSKGDPSERLLSALAL